MSVARLPLLAAHPAWRGAQRLGVVLTVVLLAAFVRWPEAALHLLWDMVIPLLPAVFLVNPMLWRNVCPLATLNDLGGSRRAQPLMTTGLLNAAWAVGAVLLVLMVPARRFLFNTNGLAMTITVSAVALLAVIAGLLISRRAGFCNSICPVLPVEKLYGQSPLLEVGSARCVDCNRCAPIGCPDVAGRKSATQSVAGGRASHWLRSPFGLFAAAFPGFILGYFQTQNGALATAGEVYGTVAAWAAGSLAAATLVIVATKARASAALLWLGAISLACYYWYAAPLLAAAYRGTPMTGEILRVLALAGIAAWALRGWRRGRA